MWCCEKTYYVAKIAFGATDAQTVTAFQTRYRMVEQMNPDGFKKLIGQAQFDVAKRWMLYEQMSKLAVYQAPAEEAAESKPKTDDAA